MRLLAGIVGSVALLTAEPVYLREVGNNSACRIVAPGASNTTPIQVTCATAHNFQAGDLIQIANVPGNSAANGLRKVKSTPSPKTFTISDVNGEDIAGNGAWVNGDPGGNAGWIGGLQIAGKVAPHELKAHPRLLLDPDGWTLIQYAASIENGLLTSVVVSSGQAVATYAREHGLREGQAVCVYGAPGAGLNCANPRASFKITAVPTPTSLTFAAPGAANGDYTAAPLTVSAWAQGGNPAWLGVNASRSDLLSFFQVPATDSSRERSLNFALICYVNRADAEACEVAKWAIAHIEETGLNFGLDETQSYGGDPVVDYISFRLTHAAQIYSLIRPQLSPEERSAFASKVLNDLNDPVLGGNCDKLLRTNRAGTISKAKNDPFAAQPITGEGTHFLTELPVGSVILPRQGVAMYDGQFIRVTAVTSDTEASGVGVAWSGAFSTIAPRTANSCGAIWYSKHHPAGPLSQPLLYPPNGGTTIYGSSPMSNVSITKTWAHLAAGLALADDDPRARQLAAEMSLFFTDYTWPLVRNFWTGFSHSGSNYHYARVSYMVTDIISMLRNSLVNVPDMTGGQYLKNLSAHLRFIWAPNATKETRDAIWAWGGDGAAEVFNWSGGRPASLGAGVTLNPTDPEILKGNYWRRHVFKTFDAETLGAVGGLYASGLFLRVPPTLDELDYTGGPTQRLFRGTDRDVCLAQGQVTCPADGGFDMMISRSGWTDPNDTAVGYDAADFYSDHAVQRAGDYVIYKTARLVCGGNDDCGASSGAPKFETHNQYAIGGLSLNRGEVSTLYGNIVMEPYDPRITRWAGGANDDGVSDNTHAYLLNDLAGTYRGNAVSRFHRHLAHLKKPGTPEYVVIYDDVATVNATSIRFFTHYSQNGGKDEGDTSCEGGDCGTLDSTREVRTAPASRKASVVTRFVAPEGGDTYVRTDRNNGSYALDNTNFESTFRVTTCAGSGECSSNAKRYEMLTVHRIRDESPRPAEVWPLNPGPAWTGVELSGKAMLFARGGELLSEVPPFRLDHNGEAAVLVAGLQSGTYRFTREGATVENCVVVVANDDNTAYCDIVQGGEIAVLPVQSTEGFENGAGRGILAAVRTPAPARAEPATGAPPSAPQPVTALAADAEETLEFGLHNGVTNPPLLSLPFGEFSKVAAIRLEGLEGRATFTGNRWETLVSIAFDVLPEGVHRGELVVLLESGLIRKLPVLVHVD